MPRRLQVFTLTLCSLVLLGALVGCVPSNTNAPTKEAQSTSFAEEASDNVQNALSNDAQNEPTQTTKSSLAEDLEKQFTTIANSTPMNISISFVDLTQPQNSCSFNGNDTIRSASTIKLMVLYELLQQVSEGLVSLDETYTLTNTDIVGGTGVLQGYGAGYTTTLRNLAELMINRSDNVATNVIINRVGADNVNARAAELGLKSVQLNRQMMDTAALAAGIDNYLSSADATTLLTMIHKGTFVNPEMSSFALSALTSQTDNQGILTGLPAGTVFAHKTGTLSNAQNDCGIVKGDHPYALAVFCEANNTTGYFSAAEAFNIMQRVAQSVSAALAE